MVGKVETGCTTTSASAASATVLVRLDTDEGLLVLGIGMRTRIQAVDVEIVVITAAPTPVEVEIVVGIVSVANESMTSRVAEAAINHGTRIVQLVFEDLNPFSVRVVVFLFAMHGALVVEIGLQGSFSARIGAIIVDEALTYAGLVGSL